MELRHRAARPDFSLPAMILHLICQGNLLEPILARAWIARLAFELWPMCETVKKFPDSAKDFRQTQTLPENR